MSENIEYQAGPTYRVRRRGVMDGSTKRLAIIAGGLGAALLAVVGVYMLSGHRGTGHVPVIEADSRPMRVKPDNPGGMQIAGSNDELLAGDPSPQAGKLGPAPEAPEPEALKTQAVPKPTPLKLATPKVANAPATTDEDEAPDGQAPATAATTPPAAPPASAAPALSRVAPAGKPDVGSGHVSVQIAALETEGEAKTEWTRLAKKMPDVFGSRSPAYSKVERDGKTWWRLRIGGFSDSAQAKVFCEKVKAKGTGCSVPAL